MISQAAGLAEAVGFPFVLKTVKPRRPWRWLPGHMCPGIMAGLSKDGDPLTPPWPDLLITCGRRSVAVSIALRRASRGRMFTVHVQDPNVPGDYFDMVFPPRHDAMSGPNVFPTSVALHRVTAEKLDGAGARFSEIPRPRVAVLIGGSSRAYRLTAAISARLASQLKALALDAGAGLIVSGSRRTGDDNMKIIRGALEGTGAYVWDGAGENPYFAMLAAADHILVTEDSVSMASEASSTGTPLHIIALEGGTKRLRSFHEGLYADGIARVFDGTLESWRYDAPQETARCAGLIRKAMANRL